MISSILFCGSPADVDLSVFQKGSFIRRVKYSNKHSNIYLLLHG